MRTQIKLHLKRLISLGIAFALLLSTIGISGTIVHAAENDFEEVTVSLNSTVVNDSSITLYLCESVHYISIDDLCELTRCSKSVEDNIISVTQGFWRATFDVEEQLFDDGYQSVVTTILEVSKDEYAVPALMFLSYFKAIAFIENDTLYCRMPEFTAWEALNIDYSNSLVDIYELYGGEGNVTFSLTLDIIMDIIMGDMSTSDDYLSDAFLEALKVDLSDYSSVQKYKESSQSELYADLHSDKGEEFVEAIEDTLGVAAEPTQWYIQYYYNAIEKSFISLAYDAFEAGQHADVKHYGEKFYEAFTEKNKTSETAEKYFDNADYVMLFVSAAVDTAQQMKYTNATNNLVYNVMGQKNLNYLGISADDNDWFTVANRYQNVLGVAATQIEAEAMQLFTDKLCWETLIGTGVSSAAGISGGAWAFSLNFARLFVENFPLTSSSVEAFKADRRALYLSELQQNVYWVAMNTLQNMQGQWDNPEIYAKYIQALQLYCRTSIAMYENLITMVDEFGQDRDYWTSLFQARIDMLAVSLYQLTTLQDDGVNACLPLDLETFVYDIESIDAPNSFVYVDVGASTAALTQNGDLYMWGMNDDGEIGNGTTTDQFTPQKIIANISYVTCNGATTAAIDREGNLYMWGNNEYGTVGIGIAQSVYLPTKVLDNVKSVEFGGSTVYALTNDGELYTWGMNTWGQVGNGNETDQFTPYQVMSNIIDVVWCYNHVFAITQNGDLYSWGFNRYGQLGNGSITNQSKPIKVLSNVNSVCGGREFSGAVTNSGELYMWGRNNYGQLGDGTTIDRLTPVRIMTDVVSADVNEYQNALAITTDDSLYVWGYNFYGQVGNGTEKVQNKPVRVLTDVIYATIGYSNVAAITSSNELYIWGDNVFGQIGDGEGGFDSLKQTTPKKVMENVRQVTFPSDRNVLAISLSGDLYSWGEGENGKTGNGKTSDQHTPALILENVLQTYSQGACMNAITNDGKLFVWGYNMYGQLGTGSKKDQLTPYEIDISDISDAPIIQTAIQEMDGGIYAAFIEDGGYLPFIDGSGLVGEPSVYTVIDIDQDGTPELLLNADDGFGFCMTYIFSTNNTTQSINLVDSIYSYAGISYSEPNRCITYCYPKPTAMEGGREFFKLSDGKFILTFGIYYTDYDNYSLVQYNPDGSVAEKTALTESQWDDYVRSDSRLDWQEIP